MAATNRIELLTVFRETATEVAEKDFHHIVETASIAELGIDSLGLVEAIFAIEEAFDIQVPFNANDPTDSAFDISTVDTMVRAVESLIAAQT